MRVQVSANPILIKELRGRMRGPRAHLFLTATLALLGGVSYGLYRLAAVMTQNVYGGVPQGALIGRGVFTGLVYVALMVICAATPFLTAGAISGEHERKTVDLLLATPLSPSSLLWGKLVAALSYVALVLLAAIPLASLSFAFGGVSTEDMLKALFLLLAFAVSFGVMGLFFSALFRRTGPALVASYLVLALFILGTMFAYLINTMVGRPPPNWLLVPNPFAVMASMLMGAGSPFAPGWFPVPEILGSILGPLGGRAPGGLVVQQWGGGSVTGEAVPLWHHALGLYAWLTAMMYLASTQLVRPMRRFRLRARTWAAVALIVLASLLAAAVIFGPFTLGRLVSWMRWLRSPPRDLVVNGTFDEPLEQTWEVGAGPESGSEVEQVEADGRPAVRLARAAETPAEVTLSQVVSRTVAADGWLQVRAVLRIVSQDASGCGEQGDACPLMIKLTYDDAAGRQHEWLQGFYTSAGSGPPFCTACETRQPHVQVPVGEWHTYESANLLQGDVAATEWLAKGMPYVLPPPPRFIRSIAIAAAGRTYESEVAEVALISREGRPLTWDKSGATADRLSAPVPAFAVPVRVPAAVTLPVAVPPTPTPARPPTPAPTGTPVE